MRLQGLIPALTTPFRDGRFDAAALAANIERYEVLPLSGVTHMTPQEVVAENLLLLQLDFLRRALGLDAAGLAHSWP